MAKLITKKQASKCATIVSQYSLQQAKAGAKYVGGKTKVGAKKVSAVAQKSFAKLKSLFNKK
jgi:hypothetical protein